jgi:hypothetical protein
VTQLVATKACDKLAPTFLAVISLTEARRNAGLVSDKDETEGVETGEICMSNIVKARSLPAIVFHTDNANIIQMHHKNNR